MNVGSLISGSSAFSKTNLNIWKFTVHVLLKGFPYGSAGKESACSAGDLDLIPGLGRSPEEEKGYPLQYSCLENPMDRGDWWATVHELQKSDMTKQLKSPDYFLIPGYYI